MDNYIPNNKREVTGIGKGAQVADEIKNAMPTGDIFDKNKQKNNTNNTAPPALPWEISGIVSSLGDIFVKSLEIKTSLNNVRRNPAFNSKQDGIIYDMLDTLDNINAQIAKITSKLDDLALKD